MAEDGGGFPKLDSALSLLASTEPQRYLSPSPELSSLARDVSVQLFSALRPLCPNPPPLDRLLADAGFDYEQIWLQIDPISKSFVSHLRRRIARINPADVVPGNDRSEDDGAARRVSDEEAAEEEEDDEDEGEDGDDEEESKDDDEVGEDDEEGEVEEWDEDDGEGDGVGIEDKFLKISELEEYMEMDEAKEYGHLKRKGEKGAASVDEESEEESYDDEREIDGDDDDEDGQFNFAGFDGSEGDKHELAENAKYGDFFGSKRRGDSQKKGRGRMNADTKGSMLDNLETGDGQNVDTSYENHDDIDSKGPESLSTHEKQLQKIKSKINQMEKANLEPKSWTMLGEVTADKRPKNSVLEVDLDFEHNVRPPPVITAEINTSLEDLIKRRIVEGLFDDVQRAPALPSSAPKERKEMDEKKSEKGLAEIYEEEYAQKAGLAVAPLSTSDKQKNEADILFKKICLKLDALSHFHFAPKPVIEDMSIPTNVPALAMEEIAPLAVSDAAMLAPEEIFQGKGNIKEEAELTRSERKQRRASKKRKFRAETLKRDAKKLRKSVTQSGRPEGNDASNGGR